MCGRFDFHGDPIDIEQTFGPLARGAALPPGCYNVAPTMPAATLVLENNALTLQPLTFGLKRQGGGLWINARAESLLQKPNQALQTCAVLVNGFYEWRTENKVKQPYYFRLPDQPIFALAAVRRGDSFLVLTCDPNSRVAQIHGRMPVVLDKQNLRRWLTGDLSLLQPYPAERMHHHPVSRSINDARFDGPDCIVPAA